MSASCCNGTQCGTDCDDTNAQVNTAAVEVCNGVDDDCSGMVDDAPPDMPLCPGGICVGGGCSFSAWDQVLGGPNGGTTGIAADAAGNLYITGAQFGQAADFGAGPTTTPLVASYTADGTLRWVYEYTGDAWAATGFDVAVDSTNARVYVLAKNLSAITLDTVSVDTTSGFIAALDTDGNPQWARDLPVLYDPGPYSIAARSGGVVVACPLTGSFDFGSGTTTSAVGTRDGYVAAYDGADGTYSWVFTRGGSGSSVAFDDVDIGGDGSVYVAGSFSGTVDFGDGPVASMGSSAVALKIGGSGYAPYGCEPTTRRATMWSMRWALELRYCTWPARLADLLDTGDGAASGMAGQTSGFVVGLTLVGDHSWHRVLTNTGSASTSSPNGAAVDEDDGVWLAGGFVGTVSFGGGGSRTSATGDYSGDSAPGRRASRRLTFGRTDSRPPDVPLADRLIS